METIDTQTGPMAKSPRCPFCGSSNTVFKEKAREYECLDCEKRFPPPKAAGSQAIDLSEKATEPKRIFFSYGHDKNRELVDMFKADLEKRGHSVWIDYKEIGVWDEWRGRITQGIHESQLAVAFLSEHSVRDPGVCQNEIAMALDHFHTVYPVLLEPEQVVSPPVTISYLQWQDLSQWRDIRDGKVTGPDWARWYEARLVELLQLVENKADHFAGKIDVLERILQPLSFTSEIAPHVPGFTGRQWVFDTYQNWLEQDGDSRLFWLQAGPGVGKTALAAVLANNHPSAIVAAWFCRADSLERRAPLKAIRTLAMQLAARWPDYRTRLLRALETLSGTAALDSAPEPQLEKAREALGKLNATDLFHRLIKQPMAGLIWRDHKLVILIDALDEATDAGGNNPLTDLLVTDLVHLPKWIGFVVTSRPDPSVTQRLAGFKPFVLDADDARNQEDLAAWLKKAFEQRSALSKLPAAEQGALRHTLLERSEGMFLYLRQAIEAYDNGIVDIEGLRNPPKGLYSLYALQFRQRFAIPSIAVYDEQVKPLLRLLLAARGPLPESLARSVLDDDMESWQRRKDRAGSYLLRTPEGLLLFHKTLAEWLQSEAAGEFRVDPASAREALTQALWADFEAHEEHPLELQWKAPVAHWLPRDIDILFAEPLDRARNTNRLARFLHEKLAEYDEAERLLRQALDIRQKALGPKHPDTAQSLNNLAGLLQAQGKFDEAERLLRQALDIRQRALGPKHPDTARSLHNLAFLLQDQGKLAEAEPLYRQALEIKQKALDSEHTSIATSLNNLAVLLKAQGNFHDAEPLYRQALNIRQKALGPDHPDTAISIINLASLLQDQGRLDKAEPLLRQALEILQETLGCEHPNTAASLNNLADLLQAQGKFDEAEPLFRQALDIRQKALGPEHPTTATSFNNLAHLLQAQGKLDEAEPLCRQALYNCQKALGPDHPDTATSLNNLAYLLQAKGKFVEAEPLCRQALEMKQKVLGSEHPTTATSLNNLAYLLQARGKFVDAELLFRQALEIKQKALGSEHTSIATSLNNLARLLKAQDKLDEAEPLYRQALEINQKALGSEHPTTATSLNNLAYLLQARGKFVDAEPLFRQALEIFQKTLGPEHPTTATILNNLASLLQAQGKLDEAARIIYR